MKPVIVYVDDEPMNLTVLEAALPTEWEIHTYDSPLKALEALSKLDPWIVISDQKMPGMTGVSFLEIVKKTNPNSMRVIVTGFSDEDLVVDSVRKAQISDYIKKPWDVDDLAHRMQKLVETYQLERDNKLKTQELENKNKELQTALNLLETGKQQEKKLRVELESWAPPFILETLERQVSFPLKRDLTLITYDLINSSELHSIVVDGKLAKTHIMHKFTELVLKFGGWREHHSGDLAYAHFGLLKEVENPCDMALAVASEFRVFLKNFNIQNGTSIECGLGLHYAKDCLVDLHEIEVQVGTKRIFQKSFDTSSIEVDLVFRIEKLAHELEGTNILMSEDFASRLKVTNDALDKIEQFSPKGYGKTISVYVKRSVRCSEQDLLNLNKKQAA
jgi:FixJ family two-component response regulator/class 3 adenylate cyclase